MKLLLISFAVMMMAGCGIDPDSRMSYDDMRDRLYNANSSGMYYIGKGNVDSASYYQGKMHAYYECMYNEGHPQIPAAPQSE